MLPIYTECKFGIDDSINSIIETILERLKPKRYIDRLWDNIYSVNAVVLRLIKNH